MVMLPNPGTPVSFRQMQTAADLVQIAGTASAATLDRISTGFVSEPSDKILRAALNRLIFDDGGRVPAGDPDDVYWPLLVAAARPEDDFDAFITSTAILLADRLQGGAGTDDLYWNWDAFLPHYRLLAAPVRSVLMQGFLRCHELGYVVLDPLPEDEELLSRSRNQIFDQLSSLAGLAPVSDGTWPQPGGPGFAAHLAQLMVIAMNGFDPVAQMAGLWARYDVAIARLQRPSGRALMAAVRYHYEVSDDFKPESETGARVLPIPLMFSGG